MTNNKQLITNNKKGIVSLGAIILLGGIIVEIALAIAIIVYVLNKGSLSLRSSAEALAAAHSGIEDGLLRILRNDIGTNPYTYDLPNVENRIAKITICEGGSPECSSLTNAQKRQITSTGFSLTRSRKLVAVVELDSITRLMKIESVREVPL